MALSIGIVGLPNVGKSTLFNALTRTEQADAANYPFCTIEPNVAIVPVPDDRLDRLGEIVSPQRVIHATIEFVDIAGLVKGASRGEGLGNKFLGNIRETAAIVHVVRCFEDENVAHVAGGPNPRDDIETIATELILADLEQVERKIERLAKQAKGDKAAQASLVAAQHFRDHLATGLPALRYSPKSPETYASLARELHPLTAKPMIYAANVDEPSLTTGNKYVDEVRTIAGEHNAEFAVICAKLEEELANLDQTDREEFLQSAGVGTSGLELIIRKGFHALGLISFFTAGPKEVRAWVIQSGSTALKAAGAIHTDFERGFIRAEVIPFEMYEKHRSEAAAKAAGVMSTEGREYRVQDADVIYFRFNV